MLSAQLPMLHKDVELLGETMHRECSQLAGRGIDVSQVMARMVEVAAAGQHQPAAVAGAGCERRGETTLRDGESDADVPAAIVPVGGVDPDVDRLVGVG